MSRYGTEGMSLEEELENALIVAAGGEPMGPNLVNQLQMAARSVMVSRGMADALIRVLREGRMLTVEVTPPLACPRCGRSC